MRWCKSMPVSPLTSALVVQSNPFGDAKPVDAAAKLREFEERETKRKVCIQHP